MALNLASGVFGKGFGHWAARYCRGLLEIEVPYDAAIEAALKFVDDLAPA